MLLFPGYTISRVISNWYATRSSNNTTIYMDLGESSTSFRIHCLEFYFPRHSVAFSLSLLLSLSLSFALFFFLFSPHGSPSRFHPADRFAGHQRGFIPHSETGVISHGWIGNPLSLRAPPRTYLPPLAPLRQCLFAHSMGDYVASEFAHSRKVRASRRRSSRNRPRLTLRSLTQRSLPRVNYAHKRDMPL